MSGQVTAGRPGNGERRWLEALLAQVQELNNELHRLAPRVVSLQGPGEEDLRRVVTVLQDLTALVDTTLSLLVDPEQDRAPRQLEDLVDPLRSLETSLADAWRAVNTYGKTLKHEDLQQGERRSNEEYAKDQDELDILRLRSKTCLQDLLAHLRKLIKELRPRSRADPEDPPA
jgi:hypothetical protein